MSLPSLPTELILEILSRMSPHSLGLMQQTNRSFYTLAKPLLYRDIDVQVWMKVGTSIVLPTSPILTLLKTLNDWRKIGQVTRSINLKLLKIPTHAHEHFPGCHVGPLISQLVSHCNHLEALSMTALLSNEVEDGDLWTSPIDSETMMLPPHHPLQNLKHIDLVKDNLNPGDYYQGRHTKDISSLFFLSRVESIGIEPIQGQSFNTTDFNGLNATSLTKLHISKGRLNAHALGCILSGTPNLKSLQLELAMEIDPVLQVPLVTRFLDGAKLAQALSGPENNDSPLQRLSLLEHLSIAVEFDPLWAHIPPSECYDSIGAEGTPDCIWGFTNSIGSLKQFKNLRTLEIPVVVLLGWHDREIFLEDILPDSLKKLRLRLDCSGVKRWEWDWEKSNLKQIVTEYCKTGPLESFHFVPGFNTNEEYWAYPTHNFFILEQGSFVYYG